MSSSAESQAGKGQKSWRREEKGTPGEGGRGGTIQEARHQGLGVLGLGDEKGLPWWLRRNGRNAMTEAEAPKAHLSAGPVLR